MIARFADLGHLAKQWHLKRNIAIGGAAEELAGCPF